MSPKTRHPQDKHTMTAQISEILYYQGRKQRMCTEPLSDYFELAGIEPRFEVSCTALWRGYVGEWAVIEGRLYLIGITGTLEGDKPASLETFSPGFPDRVFAHWYSGQVRLLMGQQLEYVHGGYASTYEQDLLIDFDHGVISQTTLRHNNLPAQPNAS
jgi:hypothetical protein